MSVAQTMWIADTPGQRIDVWRAIGWQTSYFAGWIPFTIFVWQFTRGWLPDRFGGWPRLLLAHLPVAIVVVLAQTALVVVVTRLLGAEMFESRNGMPENVHRAGALAAEPAADDLFGDRRHRARR